MKVAKVCFFGNGNTMVFLDGKQAADLQDSWFLVFVDYLERSH